MLRQRAGGGGGGGGEFCPSKRAMLHKIVDLRFWISPAVSGAMYRFSCLGCDLLFPRPVEACFVLWEEVGGGGGGGGGGGQMKYTSGLTHLIYAAVGEKGVWCGVVVWCSGVCVCVLAHVCACMHVCMFSRSNDNLVNGIIWNAL